MVLLLPLTLIIPVLLWCACLVLFPQQLNPTCLGVVEVHLLPYSVTLCNPLQWWYK